MGGMPRLCTGDDFAAAVERNERQQELESHEKAARRLRRGKHTEELVEWKKG